MEVKVLGTNEKITLKDGTWKVEANKDLVMQALNVYRSNVRAETARTKTRAEVSGGGIKPWKQKGTGRARHGSRRSPLWPKGGVTFGPNRENWSRKINSKMNRKAINSILSDKLKSEDVFLVDFSTFGKSFKDIRSHWSKEFKDSEISYLLISNNIDVIKSLRNIKNIENIKVENINIYSLIKNRNLVIDKEIVDKI